MGGAEGTRTPDPHTASVMRYQLRHSPLLDGVRPQVELDKFSNMPRAVLIAARV